MKTSRLSRDGDLLLTRDSAGNVGIWRSPRLHLNYRLENENEFFRKITFSPDSQRFYKTTDNKCNVLEPAALVRPGEQVDTAGSSLATEPIMIQDDGQSRVHSLAYWCAVRFCYAGNDDRTVRIHDAVDGEKLCTISQYDSTRSITALYSTGLIRTNKLSPEMMRDTYQPKVFNIEETKAWKLFVSLNVRVNEPLDQLLPNGDEKLLLISMSSRDEVWDLEAKIRLCHKDWGERQGWQSIHLPSNEELLVWIKSEYWHSWLRNSRANRSGHASPASRTLREIASRRPRQNGTLGFPIKWQAT